MRPAGDVRSSIRTHWSVPSSQSRNRARLAVGSRRVLDRGHGAYGGTDVGMDVGGFRRGRLGVDLIVVLSLLGSLLVHEYLAGALIAVMLAGGRALDAAAARASHDLRALLERAPRFARRRVGTQVSVISLDEVAVDDLLPVGPGRGGAGRRPNRQRGCGPRRERSGNIPIDVIEQPQSCSTGVSG